jgi:hypothetical protein
MGQDNGIYFFIIMGQHISTYSFTIMVYFMVIFIITAQDEEIYSVLVMGQISRKPMIQLAGQYYIIFSFSLEYPGN